MSGFSIDLDTSLSVELAPARAAEWRSLAADLAEAVHSLDAREGRWTVHATPETFTIVDDADRSAAIARADLTALFDEYLEVVGQLGKSDEDGFSRMDALDMAKKVTHDRAGRVLKRSLRPLEADHEVARRVFSLLFALSHDTTALEGAHAALAPRPIV